MKNSVSAINFVITTDRQKTCTGVSRSGIRSFSFTYNDTLDFTMNKYYGQILNNLAGMSSLFDFSIKGRVYSKPDTVHFVPAKIGGDIIGCTRDRDGRSYNIEKGFILLNNRIYVGKIAKMSEVSNGKGLFDTSEWKKSYKLSFKEILLPETGRKIKRFNEIYKTKNGSYVWDESKLDWSYTEKSK